MRPDPFKMRSNYWPNFWSRVTKAEGDSCWLWHGTFDSKGYGRIWFKCRQVPAHRVSFAHAHGYLPTPDRFICHRCDNPACVNPAHLFEGSARDNNTDMMAKGRGTLPQATCNRGHPRTPENLRLQSRPGGRQQRICRKCDCIRQARSVARRASKRSQA